MNEEQLIQYLFNLCSDSERARINRQLESSPEDRAKLEQLRARFAQLDLIKEDVTASETLITDTLRRARLAQSPEEVPFTQRLLWIFGAAAAAVLAIAIIVPSSMHGTKFAQKQESPESTGGYEVALEQSKLLLDELQPVPAASVSGGSDMPAAASPPVAEQVVASADTKPQELASIDSPKKVDSSLLAKYDVRGAAARERSAAALVDNHQYKIAASPARSSYSYAAERKGSKRADGYIVVDLTASSLTASWSAGPGHSAHFISQMTNGAALVTASNANEELELLVRWNKSPVAHLPPGGSTNFTVKTSEGD